MAVPTGLEPAISSVTDWHVNHYTMGPYGCGGRIRTFDLRVMSPTSYQLLHSAILINLLAEEEGFEPPRAFAPLGFQDRPLQPDLGIPPLSIYIYSNQKGGGPSRTRTCDQPVMSREL